MTQPVFLLTVSGQLAGYADIYSSCSYQVGFKVHSESVPELFRTERIWVRAWRQVHSYSSLAIYEEKLTAPRLISGFIKTPVRTEVQETLRDRWSGSIRATTSVLPMGIHGNSALKSCSVVARRGSWLGWTQGASPLLATPRKAPALPSLLRSFHRQSVIFLTVDPHVRKRQVHQGTLCNSFIHVFNVFQSAEECFHSCQS